MLKSQRIGEDHYLLFFNFEVKNNIYLFGRDLEVLNLNYFQNSLSKVKMLNVLLKLVREDLCVIEDVLDEEEKEL